MKAFVCVVLCGLVALSSAEPPRFRSSRFRSRVLSRQEIAPADAAPVDPTADAAPYPPASSPEPAPYPASGITPDNPLELPTETTPAPAYGPPAPAYGPPDNSYGPPNAEDTTPNPEAETVAPVATSGRLRSAAYFLLVDPATLKRVPIAPFQTQRQRQAAPAKFRSRF